MRHRLSSIAILLLVAAVILAGVTGCERKAKERVPEATEAADLTPSGATTPGSPTGVETTAVPGETVVSAVTSTPGLQATPTLVPIGGTQPAEQPTPTTAPAPTSAPSGSESPPSSPEEGYIWHTVQRGETLSSIAQRYGTTSQAIAKANGIVNPNQIYAGQKLKIPTGGGSTGGTAGCRIRHTVKSGEWVWQIAREYGVSPYDILAANGLTIQSANTIYPGMVLCIP
jgi:LysM repeat protein